MKILKHVFFWLVWLVSMGLIVCYMLGVCTMTIFGYSKFLIWATEVNMSIITNTWQNAIIGIGVAIIPIFSVIVVLNLWITWINQLEVRLGLRYSLSQMKKDR